MCVCTYVYALVQLAAEATALSWNKEGTVLFVCDSEGNIHANVMERDEERQALKPIQSHTV
jgi:hypothetical protein